MFSLLDGFFGYNQFLVAPNDQVKTTFRTPWGTFAYSQMPFGIINIGATFQRAMDIAFRGLIHNFVVVYLDGVTIYSKKWQDHLFSLKQVFERCRKFGISLNPKKSIFAVTKGKLLGFIVSKEGMIIDPEHGEAISKIDLPNSRKAMQSFLDKINFVQRFIPNFSQVVKPLKFLVKKDVPFKWFDE